MGISESRHQRIWNQHKILRVFDTRIDIFHEKFFLGHNSTFCNLKMQMRKKLYIFKHFAKCKKLFFCKYLSFSVWFPLSLKHWSPLVNSSLILSLHEPAFLTKTTFNLPFFHSLCPRGSSLSGEERGATGCISLWHLHLLTNLLRNSSCNRTQKWVGCIFFKWRRNAIIWPLPQASFKRFFGG